MQVLKWALLFILYGICQQGIAESRNNPQAHSHGLAQMTVIYDADRLLIEMALPAVDMLGFEHAPQNAAQWQQLDLLALSLQTPSEIVNLQPACNLQSVDVDLPFHEVAQVTAEQDLEGHLKHAHDESTAHADHSEGLDLERDVTVLPLHPDIHLSYQWQCKALTLPAISLQGLFNRYKSIGKVQAQWVANG